MTQNNLDAALAIIGARENGTDRLEAAIAAYRAALECGTLLGFHSIGAWCGTTGDVITNSIRAD